MAAKFWYEIENIDGFDSPGLFIFPNRIQKNIRSLLDYIPREHLRPHVKTNKMAEVCNMMMDAGITKFKAATISESEMLAMIKAPDVLLAYPPTAPKTKRLIRLVQKYPATTFSCLVDHLQTAETISGLFAAAGPTAGVYIDLNLGMNRTGIRVENVMDLYYQIISLPAIQVLGLHAYDGNIRDLDIKTRTEKCQAAFEPVLRLKKEMEKNTMHNITLVAGGSPTSFIHGAAGDRECSPGTFVFWDKGYADGLPEQPFEWAAILVCRVISIPAEGMICVDLGHKSVAAENPQPRVHFLNLPGAIPVSQSEEHLVLKVPDSRHYKPGDVLYGIPWHICPTVALYDKAFIVEDNSVKGYWNVIARNREISI